MSVFSPLAWLALTRFKFKENRAVTKSRTRQIIEKTSLLFMGEVYHHWIGVCASRSLHVNIEVLCLLAEDFVLLYYVEAWQCFLEILYASPGICLPMLKSVAVCVPEPNMLL